MKTLLLTLISIGGLLAQSTPPNQLQIYTPAPSPVRQIGGGTVGQSGSTTLYYWVIARYSSGVAVNTTPVAIFNTVGTANLTASNYVSITWGAVSGATGYDVLRSTTPIYPANPTCTACAVTLNTPNSSVTDTGAALSDYPPGGLVQSSSTTATIYIDNSNSVPYLNTQLLYRATENLIVGLISGSIANGDCLEYSNGRIVSAGAACGSGSGSGGYATIKNNGVALPQETTLDIIAGLGITPVCADAASDTQCTWSADTSYLVSQDDLQAGLPLFLVENGTTSDDAYTACPASHTVLAYNTGQVFWLTVTTANTGAATLNVCNLGVKDIKDYSGADPSTGDIAAGAPIALMYTSGQFRLQKVGSGAATISTLAPYQPFGEINGSGNSAYVQSANRVVYLPFVALSPSLTYAHLEGLSTTNDGHYAVAVYDGTNCSRLFQSDTLTGSGANQLLTFTFASPTQLTAGKMYWLGVTSDNANTNWWGPNYATSVGRWDQFLNVSLTSSTYIAFYDSSVSVHSAGTTTMPASCTGGATRTAISGANFIPWVALR